MATNGVISSNDHRSFQCLLSSLNTSVLYVRLCSEISYSPLFLCNKYSLLLVEFFYRYLYIFTLCDRGSCLRL